MNDLLCIGSSAIQGQGIFARITLPKDMRLLEYRGEKITKQESAERCQRQNWYIFSLDDKFDLDGNFEWNPARLVNHSCAPNCEATLDHGKIWIVTLRDIKAGEEITFDYGYDLEDYHEHPCRCGAPNCAGFIVAAEFLEQLRRQKTYGSPPRGRA